MARLIDVSKSWPDKILTIYHLCVLLESTPKVKQLTKFLIPTFFEVKNRINDLYQVVKFYADISKFIKFDDIQIPFSTIQKNWPHISRDGFCGKEISF